MSEEICRQFKRASDTYKYMTEEFHVCIRRCFLVSNGILIILFLAIIISGLNFTSMLTEKFNNIHFSEFSKDVSIGVGISIANIFIITLLSFAVYVKTNEMSKTGNRLVFCYGICLFWLGFIPLIGAGEELLMLDSISESSLYARCELDIKSLEEMANESFEGKIISPIILFSK